MCSGCLSRQRRQMVSLREPGDQIGFGEAGVVECQQEFTELLASRPSPLPERLAPCMDPVAARL
jgi:hypothetical protein